MIEGWFGLRFPKFFPFPRFPGTISPDFGSASDVIIGRSGTVRRKHHIIVCLPRDIASIYLL
jgi:hypothetical protein